MKAWRAAMAAALIAAAGGAVSMAGWAPGQDQDNQDSRTPSRQQQPRQDNRDRRDRNRDQRDRDNHRDRAFGDDDDDDNDRPRRARDARTRQRLAAMERELLQRNRDLRRRLGEARSLEGDQRVEALATILQDTLQEQERLLRYVSEARGSGGLEGDGASDTDRSDPDAPQDDRQQPTDRGRDGQQPGRSEQPRQNPRDTPRPR